MIFTSSLLGLIAIFFLIIGLQKTLKKDVVAKRFSATKNYNPEYDDILKSENEKLAHRIKPDLPLNKKVILMVLGFSVSFFFTLAITGSVLICFLVAAFSGYIFPKVWASWQLNNNVKVLNNQLEQAAETMAMVIRSGGSMMSAIDKATLEIENPLKKEMEKASYELKLGKPEADVLRDLSERVKLPELEMLALASQLQREGMSINMTTVLNNIQSNIRIRQSLQEEVKSLTAENRMAVWIVAIMPFIMLSIMRFLAPDLTGFLFNTLPGMIFTIVNFILILIGVVWSLKIANINEA
jgi:tight adherence protein B